MKGLIFYFIFAFSFLSAQTTIGLLHHDINTSDGYTLYGYKHGKDIYLIDNCGEVVNHWLCDKSVGVAYLLDNGNLLKSGANNIELRDWDNNLLWQVNLPTFGLNQHHDIEPLPNGNILILSRDVYTVAQATAQGRNPSLIGANFRSEKIIEIEPVGASSLNIIWEWKFWDHLIQDFDNTKPNYGTVSNSPELLNLNLVTNSNTDWIHANAVDYNENLDQIVISSRHTNELYIIDHSTTTVEAASHTGGTSGKGGDFLWRWGNSENYGVGTVADKKLFGPHDPKWVPTGYPNAGMITVFNNGFNRSPDFSSIHLIDTQVDINGDYTFSTSFMPSDFFWSWNGSVLGDTVYSVSQSGVNMQSNGNFLLCETLPGRFSEITPSGTLVWSYENPTGSVPYAQGDVIPSNDNPVFRAEKYPSDFVGFIGKDLTPTGIIENTNLKTVACTALVLSNTDYEKDTSKLYPNPFVEDIYISGLEKSEIKSVKVLAVDGKEILTINNFNGNKIQFPSTASSGMYFIQIRTKGNDLFMKRVIKK